MKKGGGGGITIIQRKNKKTGYI